MTVLDLLQATVGLSLIAILSFFAALGVRAFWMLVCLLIHERRSGGGQ